MARNRLSVVCLFLLLPFVIPGWSLASQQKETFTKTDRQLAHVMLQTVEGDLKDHYYDPTYHGVDMQARFREAGLKIDTANNFREAVLAIEEALDGLNDSHTHFVPPPQPFRVDYGYLMMMVGSRCFIGEVKPGSDASAKGLARGDQVLTVDGTQPTREDFWSLKHSMGVLAPRLRTSLQLLTPDGKEQTLTLETRVHELSREINLTGMGVGFTDVNEQVRKRDDYRHYLRARYAEAGNSNDVLIVKFPEFGFAETDVNNIIDRARKYKALVIDLRGNSGGSVDTLKWLIGGMSEHDDRVERKDKKEEVAKGKGSGAFSGRLFVLVDGGSLSASEVFARVMQLEKRGIVVGDQTGGMVMEARFFPHEIGASSSTTKWGAQVTVANLIMKDGKSLEHIGVVPDIIVRPTAADLAKGSDPVLAAAVSMAGVSLDPAAAGKLFTFEWEPEW